VSADGQSLAVIALVVMAMMGAGVVAGAGGTDADQPTATISVESERVLAGDATRVDVIVTAPNGTDGIERLVVRLGNASVASINDASSELPGTADARAIGGNRATLAWGAEDVALEDGRVVLSLFVRGTTPGETTVEIATADGVERPNDGFYAADRENATLTVRDGSARPAGPVSLSAQAVDLAVNETTTVPLQLNASSGVGVAEASVTVPDHARVVDVSVPATLGTVERTDRLDAETVTIRAVDVEDTTVAQLTLRGEQVGEGSLRATLDLVSNESGELYRSTGAVERSIRVAAPTPPAPRAIGTNRMATDPDDDGVYEDVDGNGVVDVRDVRALLLNVESTTASGFDVSGDGIVDLRDARRLLTEVP
jgi:PKD repeat protein